MERIPQRALLALLCEPIENTLAKLEALDVRTQLYNLADLFPRVPFRLDDQTPDSRCQMMVTLLDKWRPYRSSRSTGMPWGATMSVVPRTNEFPRLVANMTVGAMGDSSRAFKYVKHSISSIWTYVLIMISIYTRSIGCRGSAHLVDEDDTGDDLCNTLINIAFHDFIDFPAQFIRDLGSPTFD